MKSIATDFVGLVGVALVSYGAWLLLPAAGFIVAGVFVIAGTLFSSRTKK